MENCLKFYDYFNFEIQQSVKLRDSIGSFMSNPSSRPGGLLIKMAATHSGAIINNRMYLPDKMRAGVSTFTAPYQKPVIITHNEDTDPIGRVVEAQYVDLSGAVRNSLSESGLLKDESPVSAEMFDRFLSGDAPLLDHVETARKLYSSGALDSEGFVGLGYSQIVFNVTDEEAIKKFLDGRYQTGSVGLRTNEAICSVCKTNWLTDLPCEHRPGEMYDGMKCFLITGDLKYDHYAIVNDPADVYSQVLEIVRNGVSEKIEVQNTNKAANINVYLDWDSKEGSEMLVCDEVQQVPEAPVVADEAPSVVDAVQDVATDVAAGSIVADESVVGVVADAVVADEASLPADETVKLLDRLFGGETLPKEDVQKLYDLMVDGFDPPREGEVNWEQISIEMEEYAAALEGDDEELGDARAKPQDKPGGSNAGKYKTGPFCGSVKGTFPVNTRKRAIAALAYARHDKNPSKVRRCVCRHWPDLPACGEKSKDALDSKVRLSPEQLDALPASAFCGPCKTFPVIDEAHYFAALDLLGKYVGDADKSKILACIERKGKIFDCSDEVDPVELLTGDKLTEEELRNVYETLKVKFGDDCAPCVEAVEKENEKLLAEVERLEGLIANAVNDAADSRETCLAALQDAGTMQDRLCEEISKSRKLQLDYLALLVTLKDGKVTVAPVSETLSTEQLDSEIKRSMESIDIKKICDKLTDGMARVPDGVVVDNPVEVVVEDKRDRNNKVVPTEEELSKMAEHALHLKRTIGEQGWKDYLKWVNEHYELPQGK